MRNFFFKKLLKILKNANVKLTNQALLVNKIQITFIVYFVVHSSCFNVYFTGIIWRLFCYFICIFFKGNVWCLSNFSFSFYSFRFLLFHAIVCFGKPFDLFMLILKLLCLFCFLSVSLEAQKCIKNLVIYYFFCCCCCILYNPTSFSLRDFLLK